MRLHTPGVTAASLRALWCLLLCMLLQLAVTLKVVAQTKPQPIMNIGNVTLHLDMERDAVLSKLRQAGFNAAQKSSNGPSEVWVVSRDDLKDPVKRAVALVSNEGEVWFKRGVLLRIAKELPMEESTDRYLVLRLYSVVRGLRNEGSGTSCVLTVTDEPDLQNPELNAKQIGFSCPVGGGSYKTTTLRIVTSERLSKQLPVTVFQELWRSPGY